MPSGVKDFNITPNFKLSEFLDLKAPLPPAVVLQNIAALAHRLQVVRDLLGKPIKITSGYRCPEHNKAVGGVSKSTHMTGQGADLVVAGMSPQEIYQLLSNWSGGMGLYKAHIHLDIRPKVWRWVEDKA